MKLAALQLMIITALQKIYPLMVSGSISTKRRTDSINYLLLIPVPRLLRFLAGRITPCEALPGMRRLLTVAGQKRDCQLKLNGKRLAAGPVQPPSCIPGETMSPLADKLSRYPITIRIK